MSYFLAEKSIQLMCWPKVYVVLGHTTEERQLCCIAHRYEAEPCLHLNSQQRACFLSLFQSVRCEGGYQEVFIGLLPYPLLHCLR